MNNLSPFAQKRAVANRTCHGGPVEAIPASKSSKRDRGLKQTNPTPPVHTKVIMQAGTPLMAKRLSKIIDEILASRAKLDAQNKIQPYAQSRVTRDAPRASMPGGVPHSAQSTAIDEGRTNVKSSGSRIPDRK